MRVCAQPGCPTLTQTRYCWPHTRTRDKARGTRQARGYDAHHDQLRAAWQQRIDYGELVTCWRCGTQVTGRRWHLGHDDTDRTIYRGPECEPCMAGFDKVFLDQMSRTG